MNNQILSTFFFRPKNNDQKSTFNPVAVPFSRLNFLFYLSMDSGHDESDVKFLVSDDSLLVFESRQILLLFSRTTSIFTKTAPD